MGDRSAERAVFGTLRVHVDPLVIPCRICERIDTFLSNLKPIGVAKVRTDEFSESSESCNFCSHEQIMAAQGAARPLRNTTLIKILSKLSA